MSHHSDGEVTKIPVSDQVATQLSLPYFSVPAIFLRDKDPLMLAGGLPVSLPCWSSVSTSCFPCSPYESILPGKMQASRWYEMAPGVPQPCHPRALAIISQQPTHCTVPETEVLLSPPWGTLGPFLLTLFGQNVLSQQKESRCMSVTEWDWSNNKISQQKLGPDGFTDKSYQS